MATAQASAVPDVARAGPWGLPPTTPVLRNDEVHVWLAALNHTGSRARSAEHILSGEERERAARFYFQRDREHFAGARAVLRLILGRYLNMEPSQLQFSCGPHGKLVLATECGADALCFNLSHSHELVLCAVARGRDIGVDVERVTADTNVDQIAERFFSPREIATFRLLPPEKKQKAFFTCWVRKEAYIKARGDGLAIGLDSFSVSFSPGEPAALLDAPGHSEEPSQWSLWELEPDPSYVAALAVETGHTRLRCWHFIDQRA
jgi:4'-phosphopantetheinyl transferase